MASIITGESIFLNPGTQMVLAGRLTFWTDHKGRSIVHVKNPETGTEDRLELKDRQAWWVIQWMMQMVGEVFEGSPILEVTRQPAPDTCETCSGERGGYDDEGNWVDCPKCGGLA